MSAFSLEEQKNMATAYTLHLGDCIEVMLSLPDNSIDAVVTDPPYGIRFMGKAWDGEDIEARAAERRSFASQAPNSAASGGHNSIAAEAGMHDLAPAAMKAFQQFSEEWAREALRVLKPGGHLLSFASARTYHRMTCGIEDAGFEVRDQIMWIFGSGFPKAEIWSQAKADKGNAECTKMIEAGFEGWARGGLKPAHEPICVARKPLIGTVAANVLAHGVGALNIDGCRIGWPDGVAPEIGTPGWGGPAKKLTAVPGQEGDTVERSAPSQLGRWPANLIHDGSDEVVALFPSQAGASAPVRGTEASAASVGRVTGERDRVAGAFHADSGSAARFFYCAKASRADRNEGLSSSSTPAVTTDATMRACETADWSTRNGNHHPTVKPTDLMAYLVRLVTPPGGVVLDPFMGSGSTGKAAMREGLQFIGIELDAGYLEIAKARIKFEADAVIRRASEAAEQQRLASRQMDLLEGTSCHQ